MCYCAAFAHVLLLLIEIKRWISGFVTDRLSVKEPRGGSGVRAVLLLGTERSHRPDIGLRVLILFGCPPKIVHNLIAQDTHVRMCCCRSCVRVRYSLMCACAATAHVLPVEVKCLPVFDWTVSSFLEKRSIGVLMDGY